MEVEDRSREYKGPLAPNTSYDSTRIPSRKDDLRYVRTGGCVDGDGKSVAGTDHLLCSGYAGGVYQYGNADWVGRGH